MHHLVQQAQQPVEFQELNVIIGRLTGIGRSVLAGLCILALVVAGIRYVTAHGEVRAVERAKWTVKAALAGLSIAVLADPIVRVVKQIMTV
ncbi:MAG: hypothetical protein ACREJP_11220 [Candidatus Methylomirabilales bacterium]